MPEKPHLVFISHSSRDTWVALQIARGISEVGGQCFLDDTDIHVGDDFEDEILASLEVADEFLLLVTPWSLERPYVWTEFGAAWFRRIPIVALLHGITPDELQARPEVPGTLKRRNMIDLNAVNKYFEQLRRRIERSGRISEESGG